MRQDLPDHHRVFDTRDYPHTASAVRANFHIYCEYPFQPLGGAAFRTAHSPTLRLTFLLMLCLNRSPVAPASRRHLITPAAVRRKAAPSENPMLARQVHSRLRNQRHQSCNEIQWIEDHVGRSIPIRRLQLVAHRPFCVSDKHAFLTPPDGSHSDTAFPASFAGPFFVDTPACSEKPPALPASIRTSSGCAAGKRRGFVNAAQC